jgi:hypothetical protein
MITPPPAGPVPVIPKKSSKKTISYLWMPDKNGNLVKADASRGSHLLLVQLSHILSMTN